MSTIGWIAAAAVLGVVLTILGGCGLLLGALIGRRKRNVSLIDRDDRI
jgi:hypothetical protein